MSRNMLVWLDAALAGAGEQLRLDEELLADGKAVLRTWESARWCVVLGRSGRAERDVHLDRCEQDGVPVLRRSSGGGPVLLGPGCLNYSLVLPLAWNPAWRDVAYSVAWVMSQVRHALGVPKLRIEGQCDLALDGRKVSGNAQRRTKLAILHHGTLLYRFDAAQAERYLQQPLREPAYRAGRAHRDFLGNLPLTVDEIRSRLVKAWC